MWRPCVFKFSGFSRHHNVPPWLFCHASKDISNDVFVGQTSCKVYSYQGILISEAHIRLYLGATTALVPVGLPNDLPPERLCRPNTGKSSQRNQEAQRKRAHIARAYPPIPVFPRGSTSGVVHQNQQGQRDAELSGAHLEAPQRDAACNF